MSNVWKVSFTTSVDTAEVFADALRDAFVPECQAVATSEVEEHVTWSVEAYYEQKPETDVIRGLLETPSDETGQLISDLVIEVLPEINWVAKSLEGLAPIQTDRFFVHGLHDADKVPGGRLPLLVDAGEAFGTGHHGTTLGCLKLIERECKRGIPQNALDLGCGTGLLAIALAKLTRRQVTASDIDPIATRVTRENARVNGVHPLITALTATGFSHPDLAVRGPYDLIVANILAGPLTQLAPAVEQHLAPGGSLILSGILHEQEQMVTSAYRSQNLFLQERLRIDEWVTLRLHG
jgi:ribosomal protein L11 methyltransferase